MSAGTAPAVAERAPAALAARALSALVMAPLALAAILAGSPWFALMIALGCGVLAWEWASLCGRGRFGGSGWTLLASVLAALAAAAAGAPRLALLIAVLGTAAVLASAWPAGRARALWHASGALYLAVPSIAMIWLRGTAGASAVLWLFLVVWVTDIAAFAAGRLIGGPKLAPRISPKKTWAGLAGGLAAAAAAGALLAGPLGLSSRATLIGLSALLSIVAQGGDLAESAIKRHYKVKDMSGLIPGHGGLFDRVDGLLAAAPAAAMIELLGGNGVLAWR